MVKLSENKRALSRKLIKQNVVKNEATTDE